MGPLTGLRVLDASRILTGPYCTMMLADLGAEVIKVEMPGTGDDTRAWGPPFLGGEAAYYLSINRNKKSLTLNMKAPEGKEIFKALASRSDVLLENFRPGTMERLGLGYDTLKAINPGLIYCSISGFGQDGPYWDKPGYDIILQGAGGLMSITGEPDGEPVRAGVAVCDIGAGMFAAFAILAALYRRTSTGEGDYIDVSMLDCEVAWLTYVAGNHLATGKIPGRWGSAHPNIVPYQAFQGGDGKYFNVAVGNDALWKKFCAVVGLSHIVDDPRFATNPSRVANRQECVEIISKKLKERPAAEWLALLDEAGVPVGPINNIKEVFEDPQVLHRNMLVSIPHPKAGEVRVTGVPVKFKNNPGGIVSHPPLLGEHTEEVLASLGYTPEQIAAFRESGVV